ncbi:putative protein isoform X2 [Capsicum galapagoense]
MTIEAQFVLSMPDRIYKSILIPLMQQDKRLGETTRKGFYLYDERHKVKPGPKIKKYIKKAREISSVSIHPKLMNHADYLLNALLSKLLILILLMSWAWASPLTGSKRDLDSQLKIISSNFMVLIMSQHEEKVMKESKRNKSHSDDVGYVESETIDPSMKMENMLPGSERSTEISQVVNYQNYKVGGTFENSNLTAKIMETRSPFMERKDNESVDLGPSTMSSKGIMLEE